MAKTFLTTLPAEVFENIAEHSAPRELKSLRLLSREACSKVFRVYTRKLFTHQAFFLNSQESLELAVQNIKHEIYGPTMKKITFLVEGVRSQKALREEIKKAERLRKAAVLGILALEKEHATLEEDYEWRFAAADKQDEFQLFGPRVVLLHRIFANIVKIGKLQELELTDRDTTTSYPAIMPGMEGFSRNDKMHLSRNHYNQPFQLVSEAFQHACSVASSKFVLQSFKSRAEMWSLTARNLNQHGQFDHIQKLDLKLCAAGATGQMSTFVATLETASRDTLKSLTIQALACNAQNSENLTVAILSKTYRCLETLQLHGGKVEAEYLLNFVKRQSKLRKLNLHDMVITAEEKTLGLLERDGIDSMLGVAGTREGIRYLLNEQ